MSKIFLNNLFPYETLIFIKLPKIGRLFCDQVLEIDLDTIIGNSDIGNSDIFNLKMTT